MYSGSQIFIINWPGFFLVRGKVLACVDIVCHILREEQPLLFHKYTLV